MKILLAIGGSFLIGWVVFGGGQAFMPIFGSLWTLLGFDPDVKEKIYLVVNSTPGVTGLKFGLITGFLVSEKMWSAVLIMLVSYLAIFLPGVLMVWWSYGLLVSERQYPYLTTLMVWLRPVIAGIALTLAIQLFLATTFPQLLFNKMGVYAKIDWNQPKAAFVAGWRVYAVLIYSIIASLESFYLSYYRRFNLFALILIHIAVGMVLLQPWLD